MDLIDEILLPGLSLSESNVALSEEVGCCCFDVIVLMVLFLFLKS